MHISRRKFLKAVNGSAAAAALVNDALAGHAITENHTNFPIACNNYNWLTFYKREGKTWGGDALEENMAAVASTGIKAFEPNISDPATAEKLLSIIKKNGLSTPSIYVGAQLHDEDTVNASISQVLEIANIAKAYGTKILVTNPNPIKWGSELIKNDNQLVTQARAVEELGGELRKMGITLAYHTHDIEMKAGAREFHHTLLNTSPKNVSFCFDVHWVYRGAANSQLAIFDVLKLYGNRIVELHIRQSVNGIWSETFSADGDIDYGRFSSELKRMKIHPHIVIEQCLESGSPNTIDVIEAHKQDLRAAKQTFSKLE